MAQRLESSPASAALVDKRLSFWYHSRMDIKDCKVDVLVTSDLYVGNVGMEQKRIEGKIQVVRPRTDRQLPVKVGGFWFNPEELTPVVVDNTHQP